MDSWIEREKRLLNATTLDIEEHMTHAKIHLYYINANNELDSHKTVKHEIINNTISEPELYKIIESNKIPNYSFVEMSSFIVQRFEDGQFKTYPMVTGIEFPPALFIYHGINSLILLYKQKSLLKTKTGGSTKRVRFSDLPAKHTRRKV
jgi:hypothetical protein